VYGWKREKWVALCEMGEIHIIIILQSKSQEKCGVGVKRMDI